MRDPFLAEFAMSQHELACLNHDVVAGGGYSRGGLGSKESARS
jgi:hypothetical protein